MLPEGNAVPLTPPTRSENQDFVPLCVPPPRNKKKATLVPENPPCTCNTHVIIYKNEKSI